MSTDDTTPTGHDHTTAVPDGQRLHWYDKTQVSADASGQWTWQWDDIAPTELLDEWARTGAQLDRDLAESTPALATSQAANRDGWFKQMTSSALIACRAMNTEPAQARPMQDIDTRERLREDDCDDLA